LIVETKKQQFIIFILQPSKENTNVHFLKPQKILKISLWTFKICPKLKSVPTFIQQNVSTFFLVLFFQLSQNINRDIGGLLYLNWKTSCLSLLF